MKSDLSTFEFEFILGTSISSIVCFIGIFVFFGCFWYALAWTNDTHKIQPYCYFWFIISPLLCIASVIILICFLYTDVSDDLFWYLTIIPCVFAVLGSCNLIVCCIKDFK